MEPEHPPIPSNFFLGSGLPGLTLFVGVPGIFVHLLGISRGALLVPLYLLFVAGAAILVVCALVALGMLALNPAHRTRANYLIVTAAFIASALVLVPLFVRP